MPWEFEKVEDKRSELVKAYLNGEPMTYLCKLHHVSRKTGYKWVKRYLERGPAEGLSDLSRAPYEPRRLYGEEQINIALDLKLQKRTWGPKKILAMLRREYPDEKWPSATWLYRVFKDYHLVTPRRFRRRVSATHPLGDVNASNDVWIADFKGWFLTQDKTKCEPLTITDAHSRYLIKCEHLWNKSVDYVWPIFNEAFREYGLPKRLRTDNGPPFGCLGVGRLTKLSINLIKAGVTPEWINPGHPEENGRHERFHLTLKEAVANPPASTLKQQIARLKTFQEEYNTERPHEAVGLAPPSLFYFASEREWDGVLRAPEYDRKTMLVRKVCQSGCIWLKQQEYFIGQTLTGEYVGIKEKTEGLEVYYGPVYLGVIKEGQGFERPRIKRKKIVRRG